MEILSAEGRRALEAAGKYADLSSLAAGERLRAQFSPELAAAALTQVELRRRAKSKLSRADEMFFTRLGLEQATREVVARWRADRFRDSGAVTVWDLGCGLGSDAMALAAAGLDVVGVEADAETATYAAANLTLVGGEVRQARIEDVTVPADAAVFLDPARRSSTGRSWRLSDLSPSWDVVTQYLRRNSPVAVKLGPGISKRLLPTDLQATWVSVNGDVVEASLWNWLPAGAHAVLIGSDGDVVARLRDADPAQELVAGPVREFIYEPDNAVIAAGLLRHLVPDRSRWLLASDVAYLTSSEQITTPWLTGFRVKEVRDYDQRKLRGWVKQHQIGQLEIKKRGVELDPAKLRQQLRPRGTNRATLVISPTQNEVKAIHVERLLAAEQR